MEQLFLNQGPQALARAEAGKFDQKLILKFIGTLKFLPKKLSPQWFLRLSKEKAWVNLSESLLWTINFHQTYFDFSRTEI